MIKCSFSEEMAVRKPKPIITLIGVRQAKKGLKFIHEPSSEKCKDCQLYRVCIENLERGRVYEIVGLRNKKFPCLLHDEGVRVVEVVESDIASTVPQKSALEGATITFHAQNCENQFCKFKSLCEPVGLFDGDKCQIVKVENKIECPLGYDLVKVLLRRIIDA